jgi:hypothetical protein
MLDTSPYGEVLIAIVRMSINLDLSCGDKRATDQIETGRLHSSSGALARQDYFCYQPFNSCSEAAIQAGLTIPFRRGRQIR